MVILEGSTSTLHGEEECVIRGVEPRAPNNWGGGQQWKEKQERENMINGWL